MIAQIYQTLIEQGIDPDTAEIIAEDIVVRLADDRVGQAEEALSYREEPSDPEVQLSGDRMSQAEEAIANRSVEDRPVEDTPFIQKPAPEPVPELASKPVSEPARRSPLRSGDDLRDIYSSRSRPGIGRQFVVPADEDPEEFAELFNRLLERYSTSSSDSGELVGTPSQLDGWARRLEDPAMRALFAPFEIQRRTDAGDEYNGLLDEAINSAAARRQRVGANVFILEVLNSLPQAGEEFSSNSKFNANGINHAEHIYAFNELVFGEQIDMGALMRGETIDVGDIELTEGFVIPDVQLSSFADYVDLQNRLNQDIRSGTNDARFDIGQFVAAIFDNDIGRVNKLKEVFGERFGENETRDLFEVPMDWLLLYDPRIDSVEAAQEEYQVLETTLTGLGSSRGEDVGGGLIRSGYTNELEALEITVDDRGRAIGADKKFIDAAQAQLGVVLPPGVSQPVDPSDPITGEGGFDPNTIQGIGDSFGESGKPVDLAEYDLLTDYLGQQYGGYAFFFDLDSEKLQVGLNQYDKPVEANSEEAVRRVHILDYITGKYTTHDMSGPAGQVTDDQLLFDALRTTEWYQTTNVSMREWQGDRLTGGANPLQTFQFDLNQFEREQIVGVGVADSIYESLKFAAQQIMGPDAEQTIGKNRLIMLAAEIDYLGYDTDNVQQRQMLLEHVVRAEEPWQAATADFSAFRLTRDSVESLAKKYYLPITDARRDEYAEMLFTGEMTEEGIIAQMRTQALSRYGTSDQVRSALQAGLTMEDYFDPYTARMELILDRPVDLMMEFPEVIEMVSADGTARPMTHAELGEYVRGLPEWGQSDQGQDTARGVVSAIGTLFGETA